MQANNRPKTDSCYVLRPYNLACLFSLLNDEVECRKYLEECVGLKGIDQAKVTDDADFAKYCIVRSFPLSFSFF
jgi:hypothetical protein